MKKFLGLIIAALLLLTACGGNDNNNETKEKKSDTKTTNTTTEKRKSKPTINEDKLKDFTKSLYDAEKKNDIEYLDEIAGNNVKSIINRQFQRADMSKNEDYDRTASNVKLYKNIDDSNRYIATLEIKTRDTKEKKQTWLQKNVELTIKDGKVSQFEEVGSREIFGEQK